MKQSCASGLVGHERVADGDLPDLATGRFIAADADLDAAEGNGIGGGGLLFGNIVHDAATISIGRVVV